MSYDITNNDTVYKFISQYLTKAVVDSIMFPITKTIQNFIEYPRNEKLHGTSGTVFVQFNVNKVGNLENVKILKTPSDGFARETLRLLLLLPAFKPFIYQGKPIKFQLGLPVQFSLRH